MILLCHAWMRVQPWRGAVLPFAEGLFGFKRFSTDARVVLINRNDETLVAREETTVHDIVLSYGLGAGVDIEIGRSRNQPGTPSAVGFLTIGALVLLGGEGRYPTPGAHELSTRRAQVSTTRTGTAVIIPYLGLSVVVDTSTLEKRP